MAELKKFLFDNFVIGGRSDTKIPEPLPEIVEGDQLRSFEDADGMIGEGAEGRGLAEEIETFNKEELEARTLLADQSGYERGYETARQELEAEKNQLWADISEKLTILLKKEQGENTVTEDEAGHLIKQALQTLVPTLLSDNAEALVTQFLKDNFNNFKHNEKLSFYIHPDIISYVQENIVKLANSNDFEGKIAIHKDDNLDKAACRVEWENGGVEYDPAEQLVQIEEMFDKQ